MRNGVLAVFLAAALAAATVGCKSAVLGQPGTADAGGCAGDLSGTWDVVATRLGDPSGTRSWTMTIDATTFSMSNSSGALVYAAGATKQLTLTTPTKVVPVTVTNVPAALNTGSLPLALGGKWSFSSPSGDEMCTVSVAAGSATGFCVGPGPYVGSANWPYPLPSPMHGRTYTASRVATGASQLGDLGGRWELTNGAAGTCTAVVDGNQLTATCTNAQPLTGYLQLTLGDDCVASGSSSGYELSARRR